MEDLQRALKSHPFLADLAAEHLAFICGCARNLRFHPGEYLMREGDREDQLYLIRHGTVSIEMPAPGRDPICLETVGPGDVLGVSCLATTAAHLDCRARETVVAIALENACLHRKMNDDPRLGYALSMRLLERTYERLTRARLQRLDVYR
jgi:CRP/FNR family transcriptional regulator, cyclic AMP receptor protein